MAEQKKKTYQNASGEKGSKSDVKQAYKKAGATGSAAGFRVGAILLWLVAIACEVLAVLVIKGVVDLKFIPQIAQLIAFLVLDLICVIIGSQLWKKSNRIDPASKKNKVKFWLWNNMGVIVAAFAFIPFVIIALTDKNADKKTKTIAAVAAVIALAIGVATSIDYNPISAEEKEAAEAEIGGDVFWTPFGHVYHAYDDCQALNQTDTLTYGSVEEAIEHNRTRMCSFCAKRMEKEEGVTLDGIKTDNVEVNEEDLVPAAE